MAMRRVAPKNYTIGHSGMKKGMVNYLQGRI
jgi:hypothetical protein